MQDEECDRQEDNGKTFAQEAVVRNLRPCRETHNLVLELRLCVQTLSVKRNKNELY